MRLDSQQTLDFDIKGFLSTLTQLPGVYRMLDERSETIYIGKAKNLRKRVSSYFGTKGVTPKQQVMITHLRSIEVTGKASVAP